MSQLQTKEVDNKCKGIYEMVMSLYYLCILGATDGVAFGGIAGFVEDLGHCCSRS